MTATLDGITWTFTPCPECDGREVVVRHVARRSGGERVLLLNCLACRGLGYIRTCSPEPKHSRNGASKREARG